MHRYLLDFVLAVLSCGFIGNLTGFQAAEDAPKAKMNVAILIFEGVELLDFTGPAEVVSVAGEGQSFNVFTVAETTELIRAMGGVQVKPDHTFKDAPRADIVVVPGGNTRNVRKPGIDWLRKAAGDAQIVMSVCMGAFLLA